MRQMKIGTSGIETSVVGLGAWAIGGDSNWGHSDDAESIRTIHHARDLGISLIDTAPAYGLGHSEEVVGQALAGRRQDFVLSTKCGLRWDIKEGALFFERDGVRIMRNTRPEALRQELEASLRRLNTDYIDIYIVHWQEVAEFPCPISDTMGCLMEMKAQGKIRGIGASNLTREQFQAYVDNGQLDLIQEKYSMLDRAAETTFFDLCRQYDVTFQPYSPLERGVLTGKYGLDTPVGEGLAKAKIKWFNKEELPKIVELTRKWEPLCQKYDCSMTRLVIAWTAMQGTGSNINVLCGARKTDQVDENAGGGTLVLDPADIAQMRSDVEAIS